MEIRKILELNIFKELKIKKGIKLYFSLDDYDAILLVFRTNDKRYAKYIFLNTTIKDIQKFIDLSLIKSQQQTEEEKILKLFENSTKKEKLEMSKKYKSKYYWFLKNDDLWMVKCPLCHALSRNKYYLDCIPSCITWKDKEKGGKDEHNKT